MLLLFGKSKRVFSDGFEALSSIWTAPNGSVSGGNLVISPTLGAELLTDGGLENWASATNLTSWTEILTGTSTINQESAIKNGGSYSVRIDVDASNSIVYIEQHITSGSGNLGKWVYISSHQRGSAPGKTSRTGIGGTTGQNGINRNPGTTWVQYHSTYRLLNDGTNIVQLSRSNAESASVFFDDISAKQVTLSTCLATVNKGLTTRRLLGGGEVVAGTQAGKIAALDSAASPANFLLCYHDGANVKLEKCVAGTYTSLISKTVTYVAGVLPNLRLRRSGANLLADVTYNNAVVGTQQTISDAGIIDNTIDGLFSTYSGNTFSDFQVKR